MTEPAEDLSWLSGKDVLVTGGRVSGLATVGPLLHLGARVTVVDTDAAALVHAADLGAHGVLQQTLIVDASAIEGFALVVTSPGFRPDSPILSAAAGFGIPIWGDVEFSWRVDRAGIYGAPTRWLVVTGTNGKTTTTSMVASILDAAGVDGVACGNIGLPVLDALQRSPHPEFLAVELSSFQLYWAPSVTPDAGVVLNIAEDHLDWHGGMEGYTEAKARALTGRVAVVGLDDARAAALAGSSPADRVIGFRLGVPGAGELGVVDGVLVDNAFGENVELLPASDVEPQGPAGVMDALAAAALSRAVGIAATDVRSGLERHSVGPHRAEVVRVLDGVTFIDDSKATNPHAARSSILAHERVVWIAGGLLKGAAIDELIVEISDRLAAVVLIGRDRTQIAQALSRHAPDVPVVALPSGDDAGVTHEAEGAAALADADVVDADAVMRAAVREAAARSRPGDTVLLAPAAASLDMFVDYGHRGRSFTESALALTASDLGHS